ncbi:MAG: DUF1326 domain-containing protein [Candidatus Tectomicrobia bacterium]|nr:DUF1326 domain-containing protein [Candidatus Tectomicrobia bacterium]
MAASQWTLKGDYFENCNCTVLCPCILDGKARPTEGHCDVALAFHIDEGRYGTVTLAGLNVVLIALTPGVMGEGNWTGAVYIDERASAEQREALSSIFTGTAGGPMQRWRSLITDHRGVKYAPITFKKEGKNRNVSIPQVINFSVEAVTGRNSDDAMWLTNTRHPVSSQLALAKGVASIYEDHGMKWDNTGRNGHYAPFEWLGP